MKNEIFIPEDYDYLTLYGNYPNTQNELVDYLKATLKIDYNKLHAEEERIKNIEWCEEEFTVFVVPKGTPRPRSANGHFYVKDAKKNKKLFKKFLKDHSIIFTRCELELTTWQPTPLTSMTNNEILLAEKGLLRPISNPDFDNLAKTYTDAIQGILLMNDNIVNPGCVKKYYSIKPRINIKLRWQKEFDSKYNERKTLSSKAYQNLILKG